MAASAYAASSAVPSRGKWGYIISPQENFRYVARVYVYPTQRYANSIVVLEAPSVEDMTALTTSTSMSTPTTKKIDASDLDDVGTYINLVFFLFTHNLHFFL